MAVTKEKVMEYAKEMKEQYPDIDKEGMRKILIAKFIHGKDYFLSNHGAYSGAIHNPMDWLKGLTTILEGLIMLFQGKDKKEAILKIIEGVLIILYDDQPDTSSI